MDIMAIVRGYKIPLLLAAGSISLIALSLILLVKSIQTTTPIQFSEDRNATVSALGVGTVAVDVEGAVNTPGLYTLPAGSRVEDAIVAAGGLSVGADLATIAKTINRAAKVVDGAKIYIPGNDADRSEDQSSTTSGLISINAATASELDTLPGVGPVTAQKIIDNRPYQTLDELVGKKVVAASLFEKIKSLVSL